MKFAPYIPTALLKPFIRQYVVAENDNANEYKVLPAPGLVIGFQYKGQLSRIDNNQASKLATAGITGISDTFKIFRNSANTGTVLVYFTETGFTRFATHLAHEIFGLSVSLDHIFDRQDVQEVEEKLSHATGDGQRIKIVETFLLSRLKDIQTDQLIVEAVNLIYASKGAIRISAICEKLYISQSPLEKRFRKIVGTTPKKFASIVRFNTVLDQLVQAKSLTDICFEHNFFDQAHFIKDFKQFTGETPEHFKRFL